VYEDSGAGVEYQRGVYAQTPIKASQAGDLLRVEIGPVQGSFPGMLRTRSYELRLPDDWPPEHVTVNGAPVAHAGPTGHNGWSYDGNTLATTIPVPAAGVETRIVIEVRRAVGMVKRRDEIDGFPGAMTRLRAAYDAMNETYPVSHPPDPLIDAMQCGDRLGYHPERASDELAHYRTVVPQTQDALDDIAKDFAQQVDAAAKRAVNGIPPETMEAQKQHRLDAMARAQKLLAEMGR
jgi:alpha-glucosidase